MNSATPAIRTLARRLLALEAARDSSDGLVGEAVRVCDKLRLPLSKLTGVAGFRSLMSRAVARAKVEVPSLAAVQVGADGSLEGLNGSGRDQGAGVGGEASAVIVAQLLGLLVTFIGEPLTVRFLRDAWPDETIIEIDTASGEGP